MTSDVRLDDETCAKDDLGVLSFSSTEEEDYALSEDECSDEDEIPYYEQAVVDIKKGDCYSCMICTVEMDNTCHMYACPHCYRVFDYECIREWALKSTKKSIDKIWKCPNCSHPSSTVPVKNRHTCWCGKNVHPEPNPMDPNSCGQTCDAATCIHGCSKTCHLGPHPLCMQVIQVKCQCGKHTKDVFCNESKNVEQSFECDDPCGLSLPCGFHKCKRTCHSGPCGDCTEVLEGNIKCYCGEETQSSVICKDVSIQGRSTNSRGEKWIGVFACRNIRTVEYSCRQHTFTEACQAPPSLNRRIQCPFSPKLLKSCPCGRSPLKNLDNVRTKCADPVPTCESICGKQLKCGKHTCPFVCHTGPCMDPCLRSDKVQCACQAKSFVVPCKFNSDAHCNTKCESLMSCRRHRCIERCCSGRSLAHKREKTVFLTRDKLDESLVEAEHICVKQCNQRLSCGRHYCQNKCHPGNCPPCLESDSNDLMCPCGKTIVHAPVRCGTVLPPCSHPCIKTMQGTMDCGHSPMPHKCHSLKESCPSCTAPVLKACNCGKSDKVRTVCFQNNVSCGKVCQMPLKNCRHECQKTCHISGKCETICKQVCNFKRLSCDHKCQAKCHGLSDCPDVPCRILVPLSCECGRIESTVQCNATKESPAALLNNLPCNEECEISKRHKVLMEAFGMQSDTSTSPEITELQNLTQKVATFEELLLPFNEPTLSIYVKQINWCSQIESFLNRLMDDKIRQSVHFKPMKAPQRRFIHELASAYGFHSESQDMEPKRSVFIRKKADSRKPFISLEQSSPLYQSFKNFQREKKLQELERSTTEKILNVVVEESHMKPAKATFNGLMVNAVLSGVTEEDIKNCFGHSLKFTLLANPVYSMLSSGDLIIYPTDYSNASVNVENDIKRLIGHFDLIVRQKFLGGSVTMCRVEQYLSEVTDENPQEISQLLDQTETPSSQITSSSEETNCEEETS